MFVCVWASFLSFVGVSFSFFVYVSFSFFSVCFLSFRRVGFFSFLRVCTICGNRSSTLSLRSVRLLLCGVGGLVDGWIRGGEVESERKGEYGFVGDKLARLGGLGTVQCILGVAALWADLADLSTY